jgi:hypothetical protein
MTMTHRIHVEGVVEGGVLLVLIRPVLEGTVQHLRGHVLLGADRQAGR